MKKSLIIGLCIALIALSTLSAATSAKNLYEEFDKAAIDKNVALAMSKYDELGKRVAKESETLDKSLDKAIKNSNSSLYYETLDSLRELRGYRMDERQSAALEEAIINKQDMEAAKWLYENSPYYNPTLSIKAESKGDNYSFSSSTATMYCPGTEIELPKTLSGSSSAGQLAGFGLTPDVKDYEPGEKITMPLTSQVLYAIFTPGVTFTDARTGFDSGLIEAKSGDVVSVPKIEAKDDAVFDGFYDAASHQYIASDESEYTLDGNGGSFEALWKHLNITEVKAGGYDINGLPKGVQIPLSVYFENDGNEDLRGLTIELSIKEDGARLVNTTATARFLRDGESTRMRGTMLVIDRNAASGSTFTLTVKATDEDGCTFTKDFQLKNLV